MNEQETFEFLRDSLHIEIKEKFSYGTSFLEVKLLLLNPATAEYEYVSSDYIYKD